MLLKYRKDGIYKLITHPSVIKDFVLAKLYSTSEQKETFDFISHLKQTSPYDISTNDKLAVNRMCNIEDWNNIELRHALTELQALQFTHRKHWEWALGIVAIHRFGKLNKNSTAVGVGSGTEPILFYLANKLNHVYATDLYEGTIWAEAPANFPENPSKYAPFPYNEDGLTVLKMNGTRLDFPSENFDIAFSFSSIEHFGGDNHSGSLKSLREIERILKSGGIAVITTEYIINDKEHSDFFNRRTIYSDLIDKLEELRLVEPLNLGVTAKTLDTVMEYFSAARNWRNRGSAYKKTHPHILIRLRKMLFTSVMLVFMKS